MKHIKNLADFAREAFYTQKSSLESFVGCGEIATQPNFTPVARRDLMAALNTCRREFKLSPSVLVTLDALMSCLNLPAEKQAKVTPQVLLTVYASNETLCFRAKGITDRQLRRHLNLLEAAGFLLRRDSANGKRFPIMRGGSVIGAFGLDLTPLFVRAQQILETAEIQRQQNEELRGLRARIRHLCANLTCADKAEMLNAFVNLARRTKLTLTEAKAAIQQITDIFQENRAQHDCELPAPDTKHSAEKSINNTASAGHFYRLNKPESNTKKLKPTSVQNDDLDWEELSEIKVFYQKPKNHSEAIKVIFSYATMLGLTHQVVQTAYEKLELNTLLRLLNTMTLDIHNVQYPIPYFKKMISHSI